MYAIPAEEFVNRVVSSKERVSFSATDAYGHLSTSRYLEFFVNHRIIAIEDEIGFVTMALAQEQQVGLFFTKTEVNFLRQSKLGEKIILSSWVTKLQDNGFQIAGIIYGEDKKDLKAVIKADLKAVNLQTGKATALPKTFPTSSDQLIKELPQAQDFLKDFKLAIALL